MTEKLADGGLSTKAMLERARATAPGMAELSTVEKNRLLMGLADAIENATEQILAANQEDMEGSRRHREMDGAMLDRDRKSVV